MTLADAAAEGADRLERAGLPPDDARRDAALLARWQLGWDAARWLTQARDPLPSGFRAAFTRLIDRRSAREPVAYITGTREFYGRPFVVTNAVLIPRPETEIIIDQVLEHVRSTSQPGDRLRIADFGTGSGCLAISLALEIPESTIIAVDPSLRALDVARQNARTLGATDRISFRACSWTDLDVSGFDIVVANPPYVPDCDRPTLAPDVRDYEPASALFAGPDGLDAIRTLVPAARRVLRPGGELFMEIGAGQAPAVEALLRRTPGLEFDRVAADLQSIPRVVIAHVPVLQNHRA